MKPPVLKKDLLFPDLSYEIIGCAYLVWDELGQGHMEKIYQKAMAVALKVKGLKFREQVHYSLKFQNETVGKGFLDFLVEEKVIVELKKAEMFSKANIDQVLNYLKLSNLQLGILINFTKDGLKFKRIVNLESGS
jgi:GxxExxY protein